MCAIAVVDKADGSGATATISGANASATIVVTAAQWSSGMLGAAFASYGTRTGNGTVPLDLADGYWWVYATETLAGVTTLSEVDSVRVTSGDDPLHYQCLEAIQATIQALSLTGLASGNVVIRKLPLRDLPCPGIVLTPIREPRRPADNARDEVSWSVQLTMVFAKSNQDIDSSIATELDWRSRISNAFSEQALSGVDEVYTVHVETGPIVLPQGYANNFDIGILILRCDTQVVRGIA